MLSKSEQEYLVHPEKFEASYAYVLKHRIKNKVQAMQTELALISGSNNLNITKNCNIYTDLTEFSKTNLSLNQADFAEREWAEPDLNRRPLARKANVLTKLDDRPLHFRYQCLI
jgi:hypothetical protein